jgi:hypothetical protein
MMMTRAPLLFALIFSAVPARGQTETADATTTARSHFQQGLARARVGDVTAALHEFEAAYAAAPHFSVLYNIGQARATLGRYVEAAASFERYLADGGEQVGAKRREEVETLLEAARSRIGQLRLVVEEEAGARVWLDGVELSRERWGAPIPLSVGEHSLLYTDGAKPPESSHVTIAAETIVEARLQTTPLAPELKARLVVLCDVPDVRVEVVGVALTKTPVLAPLLLPAGPWLVRFSRHGYRPSSQTVVGQPSGAVEVSCNQREVTPLPRSDSARLVVTTKPADAAVSIDGRPFLGAALPIGLHRLRVERDGFHAQERSITLETGKVTNQNVILTPTAAQQARERAASSKRKTRGLVLAGVGAAVSLIGVSMYAWNSKRYDDWRSSPTSGDLVTATSIQRADDVSIGLMILGGGLTLGGSWLSFGAE